MLEFVPKEETAWTQDMIMTPEGSQTMIQGDAVSMMRQMMDGMAAMAEMMRVQGERMAALEAAVRTLEKVTPQQATRINRAIRERAAAVCEDYRMSGNEKAVASEIRRTVCEMTGARAMREVARCDYDSIVALVIDWDDYDKIQRIRKKVMA